ncbi:hypothetical protein Ancab_039670 [Ancistrocladus abbreviatus]
MSRADRFEVAESSSFSQGIQLILSPFSCNCKVSQHHHVEFGHKLGFETRLPGFWCNRCNQYHLPIFTYCFVATLQNFHTIFIPPIMQHTL